MLLYKWNIRISLEHIFIYVTFCLFILPDLSFINQAFELIHYVTCKIWIDIREQTCTRCFSPQIHHHSTLHGMHCLCLFAWNSTSKLKAKVAEMEIWFIFDVFFCPNNISVCRSTFFFLNETFRFSIEIEYVYRGFSFIWSFHLSLKKCIRDRKQLDWTTNVVRLISIENFH